MAIEFRGIEHPPLHDLTVAAPNGAVIGVIGEKGAGKHALMQLAAGLEKPKAGEVLFEGTRRHLGLSDALQLSPVDLLLIEQTLAPHDALVRGRALVGIDRLRSAGSTIIVVSHDPVLLRRLCDEVWWLDDGALRMQGDPGEVLDAYQQRIAEKFRAWGETLSSPVNMSLRRGDGRAEILSLETLGDDGQPTMVWRSSEEVIVRVRVRFREAVEDPVVGILIRTRIGLEVYGTNTELEKVKIGHCAPGAEFQLEFRFACNLCPGEYTLTAASHDPDGTAHDWIDAAIAFLVTDSRYTAGVANLRASVRAKEIQPQMNADERG
ncbi:MAG TPA: Wzt carbohydrate-binding domain-containing protein [Bryobacteraceae bacterium]|nr:Wzt carbohydrate-binding domain-containing protein [Bryobacteraceae bacterium]